MKCLTLLQPWATLVVIGAKHYETRKWRTPYRGPLAIHASKRLDYDGEVLCHQQPYKSLLAAAGYSDPNQLPVGALLGAVILEDVLPTNLFSCSFNHPEHGCKEDVTFVPLQEWQLGNFNPGRYAWKLRRPATFSEPIPCKGKQGIWDYKERTDKELEALLWPSETVSLNT